MYIYMYHKNDIFKGPTIKVKNEFNTGVIFAKNYLPEQSESK